MVCMFLLLLFALFPWDSVSHWPKGLPFWLDWLTQETPWICLFLPVHSNTKVTGICTCLAFLHDCQGFELRFTCLWCKHCCLPNIFPAPVFFLFSSFFFGEMVLQYISDWPWAHNLCLSFLSAWIIGVCSQYPVIMHFFKAAFLSVHAFPYSLKRRWDKSYRGPLVLAVESQCQGINDLLRSHGDLKAGRNSVYCLSTRSTPEQSW